MAAPSGTVWGSIITGSKSTYKGRIGIYTSVSSTPTETTVKVQVWFWSMYGVSDSSNSYYYNANATSATTKIGSKSISHTVSSGDGWSTSNQTKLGESTYTYTRGTSAVKKSYAAKFTGIDILGSSNVMTATTSITVPALTSYTVKYNANGGSGAPSSQTKYYGKTLTLSSTKPKRTGYTFKCWNTKADGSGTNYNAGADYKSNSAVTLYAIWTEHYLTVNYYSNYADSGTLEGKALSVSASTNVKVLTAKFYYDDSYSDGLANIQNKNYLNLSRTGYNTTGNWGTSTSGGTLVNQNTSYSTGQALAKALGKDISSGNASINIYAQWTLKTYTVAFNANGGSGAPSNQTKSYGKTLTLSSTKPTRSGYTFMGWGTSASDTSADYSAGGSYTANSAITLYAVWKKTLTLSYNANGGSNAPSNQSADIYNSTTSKAFTISTGKPTRTGYTFLGWSTSSGATSATYSAGGSITLSANTTLYAVWQINSYKLTINPNGGTWGGKTESSSFTQNYNTTKSIANPTWAGHTFSGWTLSGSGSLSGTTFTFGAGNATLTAKWDTNDYAVTFNAGANGGTVGGLENKSVSYEYGTQIGTLPTAVKKNYVFTGWFTSASGGTKITSTYKVTKDVTFYAQYEIDASAYVNEDSVWEEGVTYVTDSNGNTKKGHAKVRANGVWKDGFCK